MFLPPECFVLGDGGMRLSSDVLFAWAYQDRAEDLSKFRQFARRWRPVARSSRDEDHDDDYCAFPPLQFGAMRSPDLKPLPRPKWSPWLWVK
jgi:hypothetical protein